MKYTLEFYKDDMGWFTQPGIEASRHESFEEQALWFVNKAREHDGLKPLESLFDGQFKLFPE